MELHCKIAGRMQHITATLEKGASFKGSIYTIANDEQVIATLVRYPSGRYNAEGETVLSELEIEVIGLAINKATDTNIM